jgi:hypothetical protein
VKRPEIMALLVLAASIGGAWAWPLLAPGYIGFDGDSLFLFYPALQHVREEVFAGRVPLWNPYKFLGSPMLANLMVPVFYPPQLLALLPPQPVGQHAGLVAHAVLGALGAYVAARRTFGASICGGLMAGLTFGLCAPMQVHVTHPNQFFSMAWLPWVLVAAMRWSRGERPQETVLPLGFVLGMQCLAGQPQIVGYSGVIVLLATIDALVREPRSFVRRLGPLAVASALALGLAAVHLVPAFELSKYSLREGSGVEFAQSFSLPLANLKTLILPNALGAPGTGGYRGEWNFTETAIYFGQAAVLLALVGLAYARRQREIWVVLAGMLAIGLVWALGGSTPLYAMALKVAPPLGQFRAPARAFVLVVLAASTLAALGLDGMRAAISGGEAAKRGALGVAAIGLALAVQAATLADYRFRVLNPPATKLDSAMVAGWERYLRAPVEGQGRVFRLMDEIDYGDESLEATRAKWSRIQPDVNALHGIAGLGGYEEGMLPKREHVMFMRDHLRRIYSPQPDTRLLGLMGVQYVLADKPVRGERLRRVNVEDKVALFENLDYRGMVFTREQWPTVDWEGWDGEYVRYRGARSGGSGDAGNERLSWREISPGRVRVELPGGGAGGERRLLLSQTWMPGWRAITNQGRRIDGRRLAPFLIEFEVPGNVRIVELIYRPRSFEIGLSVSLLSTLVMAGAGMASARRRSRVPE